MQNFWKTISKYPVFIASVILGVLLNAVKPLVPMFQRPTTAIALIAALVAGLLFIGLTLQAMLGLNSV